MLGIATLKSISYIVCLAGVVALVIPIIALTACDATWLKLVLPRGLLFVPTAQWLRNLGCALHWNNLTLARLIEYSSENVSIVQPESMQNT